MLLAKQDHARHDKIHEARTERSRPADVITRIIAAADEVDVALAVDLTTPEKERVDAPLRGAIEKLDAAVGEEIVLLRAENRDAQRFASRCFILRAHQHRAGRGNRG